MGTKPSASPSESPSESFFPSASPSESPSASPSTGPSDSPSASPTTDAPTTSPTSEQPVNTLSPSPNAPPVEPFEPVIVSKKIDVNVPPETKNEEIEENMLGEVLLTLDPSRRLGVTEEHDDRGQRKLDAEGTWDVDDGSVTVLVKFTGNIECDIMYGSDTPANPDYECRSFGVEYTFTDVAEDAAEVFVENVEEAVTDGTFNDELGFCTVLEVDTVDSACVVNTSAPTISPTGTPTTDAPTTTPTSEKPATQAPTPSESGGSSGGSSGTTAPSVTVSGDTSGSGSKASSSV